jgi:SAM-dependent methyltransferase
MGEVDFRTRVSQLPWLRRRTTLAEYVEPDYYNRLLRPYTFPAGTDLDLLRAAVGRSTDRSRFRTVLELGVGTGRAADVILASAAIERYVGVDLSGQMIRWSEKRYHADPRVEFTQEDSIKFLLGTNDRFDLVTSLWSFSHSVHQNLGEAGGRARVVEALNRLVGHVLRPGGTFYLIHFDSLSDEQRILVRQWTKVLPIFSVDEQSPSKQILDTVLEQLHGSGRVDVRRVHHRGEPIVYGSVDEALEVFINFHLEGFFNDRDDLSEVLAEVEDYLRQFAQPDGKVLVSPGCFEYEIRSLSK